MCEGPTLLGTVGDGVPLEGAEEDAEATEDAVDERDAESTEDPIEDGAGRPTEVAIELSEEAFIPIVGSPIKLMASDLALEVMMGIDPVLEELRVMDDEVDPAPGAAMPEFDEAKLLLAVGVASAEILIGTPGVGRFLSRVTVTSTVTVSIAVSVMMRYLRARSSKWGLARTPTAREEASRME
jgi:hypothetical protein